MKKLILASIDDKFTAALNKYFADETNVEVHHGDIFDHKADAIVSPANSWGYMDGGIDLVYSEHFGWDLEKRVKEEIAKTTHYNELLVGDSLVVPTGDNSIPNLIVAPTMRVPMHLTGTANAYLAFRAALGIAKRRGFESVLSPGMGTGVGNLDPEVAASQMRLAYIEVIRGHKLENLSITAAYRNHMMICRGFGLI